MQHSRQLPHSHRQRCALVLNPLPLISLSVSLLAPAPPLDSGSKQGMQPTGVCSPQDAAHNLQALELCLHLLFGLFGGCQKLNQVLMPTEPSPILGRQPCQHEG